MLACVDLLRRGYGVFRAISPQCACDVVAMHEGRLWRVEVRTARVNPITGVAAFPVRPTDECDVYAVVAGDVVGYLPGGFVPEPFPWPITESLAARAAAAAARR